MLSKLFHLLGGSTKYKRFIRSTTIFFNYYNNKGIPCKWKENFAVKDRTSSFEVCNYSVSSYQW